MNIISLLLKDYIKGLSEAELEFYKDLKSMDQFEKTVCDLSNKMATRFMGYVLSQADEMIRADGRRKRKYAIQRKNQRALISSVGDVSYTHTLYKDKKTGEYVYLLDDLMHMVPHERMTPVAEAKALAVSAVHSYQHAADMVSTTTQTITKTTVMNKVHSMEEQLPDMEPEVSEKKKCEYLYIEADEDHIHRQKDGHEEGCMIGKLAYLFEGKEEECKGRNRLIGVHYFGGLYPGDENVRFWEGVQEYIEKHYDMDHLKRVYINSDGGAWIKAGKNYIYKSVLVADRFHLMKYINRVCNLSGDKKDAYKQRFYKYIWKNKLLAAKKLLGRIRTLSDNVKAVDDCQAYFENNWKAIQKAFHDKNVYGCSAEGHVSNVLSDRMSSRPMGWSEKGSDRMCKLRCYVQNYGREKVIDLVAWKREKEYQELKKTGTDDISLPVKRREITKAEREAYAYVERMQASLGENTTVRKALAIKEQIYI